MLFTPGHGALRVVALSIVLAVAGCGAIGETSDATERGDHADATREQPSTRSDEAPRVGSDDGSRLRSDEPPRLGRDDADATREQPSTRNDEARRLGAEALPGAAPRDADPGLHLRCSYCPQVCRMRLRGCIAESDPDSSPNAARPRCVQMEATCESRCRAVCD